MARLGIIIAAALVGVAAPAAAERASDRFWLQGGAFFGKIDSYARIDDTRVGVVNGTRFDFERDLGLDNDKVLPKISGGLRLGERFRLEGDFFTLDRAATVNTTEPLRIEATDFIVGGEVDTDFKTDIYRIAVGYSPVRTDRGEFGLSLGLHYTELKFSIVGIGSVDGVDVVERVEAVDRSVPLPNVGVYGNYAFNDTFGVEGRVDFLKIKAGKYKGELIDAQVGVSARIVRNLGVGVGYRYVDYKVRARKRDFRGRFEYQYKGPIVYAELAF